MRVAFFDRDVQRVVIAITVLGGEQRTVVARLNRFAGARLGLSTPNGSPGSRRGIAFVEAERISGWG